ncbi:MAG: D-alanyl-D-alanine carboxypeptidase family protein [bacterium]|nr:D-alanyl-D-alanine carboxypeptidase family protein [bacterium]
MKIIKVAIFLAVIVTISLSAYAQGLVPCTGIDCSLCSLFDLVQNVFNLVVWTLVPILATGMIIWSGFTILTAGDKPDQVKKGRKMITATLIGIAIVYSSYILASFVVRFFAGENSVAGYSFKNGQFDIQCTGGTINDVTGKYLQNGSFSFEIKEEILLAEEEPAPEIVSGQEEVIDLGDTNEGIAVEIKTNPGVDLDNIGRNVLSNLRGAVVDAKLNLVDLKVASGFRSLDRQEELVKENCKDPEAVKCDPIPGHAITCIPKDTDGNGSVDGQNCRHTTGRALDVWGYNESGSKCCQDRVIQVMKVNGFCVYNKEPWHFELKSNLEKDKNRLSVFTCN